MVPFSFLMLRVNAQCHPSCAPYYFTKRTIARDRRECQLINIPAGENPGDETGDLVQSHPCRCTFGGRWVDRVHDRERRTAFSRKSFILNQISINKISELTTRGFENGTGVLHLFFGETTPNSD